MKPKDQPLLGIPAFNNVQRQLEVAFEQLAGSKPGDDIQRSGISLGKTIPAMVREVYFAAAHGPEFTLKQLALKEPVWPESEKHKEVIAGHSATRAVNRGKPSTAGQARQQITTLQKAFFELCAALDAL